MRVTVVAVKHAERTMYRNKTNKSNDRIVSAGRNGRSGRVERGTVEAVLLTLP